MTDSTDSTADPQPAAESYPESTIDAAPGPPAADAPSVDEPMFPQPTMEAITANRVPAAERQGQPERSGDSSGHREE